MARPLRIVHYLNQFFGQIGGEDKADTCCQVREGPLGPGLAFRQFLGDRAEIIATVICGDNFVTEDLEARSQMVADIVGSYRPDLLLAGPAFASGRYGMACGAICRAVGDRFHIPSITGMSEENPAVQIYRAHTHIAPVGKSAAKMTEAAQKMTDLALCLAAGRRPGAGAVFPRGVRESISCDTSGAVRAVNMLAAILRGEAVITELPLPTFEKVLPAPPLEDLTQARIVLVTEGGITPTDNPDRIEMSMATRFGKYSIHGLSEMRGDRFTVAHGGYDNSCAKANPNRLVPLDVLRDLASEGFIGAVAESFYSTAGNATSVENASRFGREIAQDIRSTLGDNVGVIFTST